MRPAASARSGRASARDAAASPAIASPFQLVMIFSSRPGRDEKIITSWNGLAIAGLAAASRALARPDLAEAAGRAATFLHDRCWRDGRLLSVYAGGEARHAAYLDDYAMLAWGLTELLQARWDSRWLAWAVELTEVLLSHFEDVESGGFFFTADDAETLILRPMTWADDATPAGNGVAARLLVRLGYLLAEPRYLAAAERTLRAAWPMLERYPQAHTSLLAALDDHTTTPDIVVIRGSDCDLRDWRSELAKVYDPKRYVVAVPADATGLPPALADKAPGDRMVAYVCRGTTCAPPISTLGDLLRELRD